VSASQKLEHRLTPTAKPVQPSRSPGRLPEASTARDGGNRRLFSLVRSDGMGPQPAGPPSASTANDAVSRRAGRLTGSEADTRPAGEPFGPRAPQGKSGGREASGVGNKGSTSKLSTIVRRPDVGTPRIPRPAPGAPRSASPLAPPPGILSPGFSRKPPTTRTPRAAPPGTAPRPGSSRRAAPATPPTSRLAWPPPCPPNAPTKSDPPAPAHTHKLHGYDSNVRTRRAISSAPGSGRLATFARR